MYPFTKTGQQVEHVSLLGVNKVDECYNPDGLVTDFSSVVLVD
jgi:hypothetical protein